MPGKCRESANTGFFTVKANRLEMVKMFNYEGLVHWHFKNKHIPRPTSIAVVFKMKR